eukprot:1137333-Pelagomonas_calceolata.AAC.17
MKRQNHFFAAQWGVAYELAGNQEQQAKTLKYLEWREKQVSNIEVGNVSYNITRCAPLEANFDTFEGQQCPENEKEALVSVFPAHHYCTIFISSYKSNVFKGCGMTAGARD